MQDHATDPGVFIRSMASRGHLGGLSRRHPAGAAGAGRGRASTWCWSRPSGWGRPRSRSPRWPTPRWCWSRPGMGDAIQAAKAGILEVADIFVVNKSDKPGAQEAVRDLRMMTAMARRGEGDWKPPIVTTIATTGEGIADLTAKLDAHWSWLDASGEGDRRRRRGPGRRSPPSPWPQLRAAGGRPARRLPAGSAGGPGGRGRTRPLLGRRRTRRRRGGVAAARRAGGRCRHSGGAQAARRRTVSAGIVRAGNPPRLGCVRCVSR